MVDLSLDWKWVKDEEKELRVYNFDFDFGFDFHYTVYYCYHARNRMNLLSVAAVLSLHCSKDETDCKLGSVGSCTFVVMIDLDPRLLDSNMFLDLADAAVRLYKLKLKKIYN